MREYELFEDKVLCNGCGLCVSICGHSAISMEIDEEGFLYPHITASKCIDCHLCEIKCPQKSPIARTDLDKDVSFGVKIKNKDDLKLSTSGGAFSALYQSFFKLFPRGVVYGCVLRKNDREFFAAHIRKDSIYECEEFRGSKYIQSVFWPVFSQIEKDLESGLHVMCVATPCQIAGIKQRFYSKYSHLLFLVDILCHSIPSPLIFNEHIRALEVKSKKIIVSYSFRPKTKGWRHQEEAYDKSGLIIRRGKRDSQRYKELFYAELISRPSCSQCRYVGNSSVSDATIGDFWGINELYPEFMDKMGVSLLIIHNRKAMSYMQQLEPLCEIITVNTDVALSFNHNKPKPMSKKRAAFWRSYRIYGYQKASRHYLDSNFIWLIKALSRIVIPENIKERLKKTLHVK